MKMPHQDDEQLENSDFVEEAAFIRWRPPPYRMNQHHRFTHKQPPMPTSGPYYHNQWYQPPPPVMPAYARPPSLSSEYATYPANDSHAEYVVHVTDADVLCGRGAPTSYHPGNQYFRRLVKEHKQIYLSSKRSDKPPIASKIVDLIQERGGRFLKRCKTATTYQSGTGRFMWIEIGNEKAYEKACQALREGAPDIRRQFTADSRSLDDSEEEKQDGEREQLTGESSTGHN